MGQNPEELRYDIERTREGMDATLDHIEDRVSPRRIVERRTARARRIWGDVRGRVMGTAREVRVEGRTRSDQAGSRLDEMTDEAGERIERLEREGKRQYQGNPLAAGLIAFGAGALLGSLLPETEQEQRVADEAKQRLQPVADQLQAASQEVAEDLKGEAQQKAEETKQTASRAAEAVKEDARSSAEELRDEGRGRAEHVKGEAQG